MKHYPAKILLFGEHILMQGASALATTLPRFAGCWAFAEGDDHSVKQLRLNEWADHLSAIPELDIEAFRADLARGLFFQANIPTGYGLGSSGALCAAVYDRYARQKISQAFPDRFPELRQVLATMERFFHGSSSGIDPLICYLDHPLLLLPDGSIDLIDLPPLSGLTLFLLDSAIPRQTGPLVHYFKQRCEDPVFRDLMIQQLLLPSDQAIHAWMDKQADTFAAAFTTISHFQCTHLADMVPPSVLEIWQHGIQHQQYYMKLCGAGGGGVFLGLTQDYARVRLALDKAGFTTFVVS